MDLSLLSSSKIDHIEGATPHRDDCSRLRSRPHCVGCSPRQRLAALRNDGAQFVSLPTAKRPDGSNSSTVGEMHGCTVYSCMSQRPFDESSEKKQSPLKRETDKHVIKILPRVAPSLVLFGAKAACCRKASGWGPDGISAKELSNQVAFEEVVTTPLGSLPDACHAALQHTSQATVSPRNASRCSELLSTAPPNGSWLRSKKESKHPTMLFEVQPKLFVDEDVCQRPQKTPSPKRKATGKWPQAGIEEGVTVALTTFAQDGNEIDLFHASPRNKYDWLRSSPQSNQTHKLSCTKKGSQQKPEVEHGEENPTARIHDPTDVGVQIELRLIAGHDEMVDQRLRTTDVPESSPLPSLVSQHVCNVEQLAQWPCIKSVVPDPLQQLSSHDIAALMLSGAGNLDTVFILLSALQRGVSLALGGHTSPFQAKAGLFMATKSRLCARQQRDVAQQHDEAQQRRSLRRARLYKNKPKGNTMSAHEKRTQQTNFGCDGQYEEVTRVATAFGSCAPPSVNFNVTDRGKDHMARPAVVQSPALPAQDTADANDDEAKIDAHFTRSKSREHCETMILPGAASETTDETRASSIPTESPYMLTVEASPGVTAAIAVVVDDEADVVASALPQVVATLPPVPSPAPASTHVTTKEQSNEITSMVPTVSAVALPIKCPHNVDAPERSRPRLQRIENSNTLEMTSTVSRRTMPATCIKRNKESARSRQHVHRNENSTGSIEVKSLVSMETMSSMCVVRNDEPAPSGQHAHYFQNPINSVKQQSFNQKVPTTILGTLQLLPKGIPAPEVALTPQNGVCEKQQLSGHLATEKTEDRMADISHETYVSSWNPPMSSGDSSIDDDDDNYWDDEMYGSAWKAFFDDDAERLLLDDAIEQRQRQKEVAHDNSKAAQKAQGELRASIIACAAPFESSSPDATAMALLNAARQGSGSSGKWMIEVKPPLVRVTDRTLEDYSPQSMTKRLENKSQRKKRHQTLVETVFSVAEKLFAQCHWRECVKATTTIICNHCRDIVAYTVAALELRAAVWMRLENWHQVVTDTTAVLRYKLTDASKTTRAYARRAHARYTLSSLVEGNDEDASIHLKHCAIVDARESRNAQEHHKDSTNGSDSPSDARERTKMVWDAREDGPRLMRAKVLRGVGMLHAAQAELEAENKAKHDDWRVMWSLGEVLAAKAGIEWHDVSAATTAGGVKTQKLRKLMENANLRKVDKAHMDEAATLMARAVQSAQRADEIKLMPFQLVMTFGDVQIARLRATRFPSMFDVPNDNRMAAKLANNHYAGEPPPQPSNSHVEATINFREELVQNVKYIADRFEEATEHKKQRPLLFSGTNSPDNELESHSSTSATVHEGKGIFFSSTITSVASASSGVAKFSNNSAEDPTHSRRNTTLLRAGMALQLARIYFETKNIVEARSAVKSALRLFAAYQGLPRGAELEVEDMQLENDLWLPKMNLDKDRSPSHDEDDITCTTVSTDANCRLNVISQETIKQLEALSRLILGMSFACEVEDAVRRTSRHVNDTSKTTYPICELLRSRSAVSDTDDEPGQENEQHRCMLAAAERQLDLANQLAPHNGDILCARAAVRAARGHAIGAMSDLESAVRLEPSVRDAHVARASLYMYNLCDFDAAERAAVDAKSVSPTYDIRPRLLLAASAAKRGKATACQRHLSHACHMFPADAAVHRLRAMAAAFPAGSPSRRSALRFDKADDYDDDMDKRRAATIVAQAADCFVFCVKQYGREEWRISSTQLHEYSGHLAMTKDSHAAAIKDFEAALSEIACSKEDSAQCSPGEHRSRRRAALGMAESSVYCGKYDRASDLIEKLLNTSPQHHPEEVIELARLEHLRARVFAANDEIGNAYAAFDRALELYTRLVVEQGLTINVSHFAADNLYDNANCQFVDVLEKASVHNVLDNSKIFRNNQQLPEVTPKRERVLSTAQRGRAHVLYHRAIFRAGVTLRFGMVMPNEDLRSCSRHVVPTTEGSEPTPKTEMPTKPSRRPVSLKSNNRHIAKHKDMQRTVDGREATIVHDERAPKEESEEECKMRQMTEKWVADARRYHKQERRLRGMARSRTIYRRTKLHSRRARRQKQARRGDENPEEEVRASSIGDVVAGQRRPERPSDLPRYAFPVLAALGFEDLGSAIRQNPWHHEARLLRAELHAMGGNFEAAAIDCQIVLDTCFESEYRPACKALVCRSVLKIQDDVAKGDDVQLEASSDLTKAMELLSNKARSHRELEDEDDDLLLTCAAYNRGIARAAASKLREAHVDFTLVIDLLTAKLKVGNLSKRRAWQRADYVNASKRRRNAIHQLTAAFGNRAVVAHWIGEMGTHCLEDVEKAASLERELALAFRQEDPTSAYVAGLTRTGALPNASTKMVDVAIAARQLRLKPKRDRWSLWRRAPRDASPRLPSVTIDECALIAQRTRQKRVICILMQRAVLLRSMGRPLDAAGACAAALASHWRGHAPPADDLVLVLNQVAVSLRDIAKAFVATNTAQTSRYLGTYSVRNWPKVVRSVARGEQCIDSTSALRFAKLALVRAVYARPDCARSRFNLAMLLYGERLDDAATRQLDAAKLVDRHHTPSRIFAAARACDEGRYENANRDLYDALSATKYSDVSARYPRELTADRVASCAAASKAIISINLAVLFQIRGEYAAAERSYAKVEQLDHLLAHSHSVLRATAAWARTCNSLVRCNNMRDGAPESHASRALHLAPESPVCLQAVIASTAGITALFANRFDDAENLLKAASDKLESMRAEDLPDWLPAQTVAAVVWANRASTLMATGYSNHSNETISFLNKSLAHLPHYTNLHRQLAGCLQLANRFLLAMKAFSCALAVETETTRDARGVKDYTDIDYDSSRQSAVDNSYSRFV